ncbi:hypothetical protein T484DRAFT_1743738 [Baffinella frigidus]|nr:hypothetical protein T484DRAFT_1743738 [Cryptophyta sp. CCMP2293]
MAPAPNPVPALVPGIEASTDAVYPDEEEERFFLDVLAQTETPLQANPWSPATAAGEANNVNLRRSNADRHQDDARYSEPLNDTAGRISTSEVGGAAPHQDDISTRRNRFQEPLDDLSGRLRRVFRKTPPPIYNRHQSTSEIAAAAPSQDDICGSSARLNRFEEPLNDSPAAARSVA